MRTIAKLSHVLLASAVLWPTASTSDERFLPLIDWLTANSELEYNGEPLPTIEYLPYGLLEVTVYGDATVAKAEHNGIELPTIRGSYDDENNVMMLPDGFDWGSNMDVIVHELVHFLQHINGPEPACLRELEPPAYKLHWQWVEDTGYEAEEPNWLFVYLLTMGCYDMPYDYNSPPFAR